MARASWIHDDTTPDLDAHIGQLEHFTQSLADGVIDAQELATQEQNLVEVAAYSVMRTLHEMAQARVHGAMSAKKADA